jgi:hypothetical protein
MDLAEKKEFLLDASANGCTGMFWRTAPDMDKSTSGEGGDWPRNGTTLHGWYVAEHPGWVKLDRPEGYWMPLSQHGKPILHEKK